MSNKHVVFGAGGVIIGLLAGVAVGGAVSESRMAEAIGQSLTPAQEASAEAATSTQEALAVVCREGREEEEKERRRRQDNLSTLAN